MIARIEVKPGTQASSKIKLQKIGARKLLFWVSFFERLPASLLLPKLTDGAFGYRFQ